MRIFILSIDVYQSDGGAAVECCEIRVVSCRLPVSIKIFLCRNFLCFEIWAWPLKIVRLHFW